MPRMDGVEATRRIRQLAGGDKVKIVAVTASVFADQQQELFAAGMDDFVNKPYRFEALYDCLARQLGLRYRYADEMAQSRQPIPLTPSMLTKTTADLRRRLQLSLESLDSSQIAEVIERITESDTELGLALSRLADVFDYPSILALLKEVDAHYE